MTLANNQFKPLINMWMIWLISQPQEKCTMRICMSNGDLIPHSVMYVLDMVPLILLCFNFNPRFFPDS